MRVRGAHVDGGRTGDEAALPLNLASRLLLRIRQASRWDTGRVLWAIWVGGLGRAELS